MIVASDPMEKMPKNTNVARMFSVQNSLSVCYSRTPTKKYILLTVDPNMVPPLPSSYASTKDPDGCVGEIYL